MSFAFIFWFIKEKPNEQSISTVINERIKHNIKHKLDDPKWTPFVDKLALHAFAVAHNIPSIKPMAVYDTVGDIAFDQLPKSFALKSNKASSRNLVVHDHIIMNELMYKRTSLDVFWSLGKRENLRGKSIKNPEVLRKVKSMMANWGAPHGKDAWWRSPREKQYDYTKAKIFLEPYFDRYTDYNFIISNKKLTALQVNQKDSGRCKDFYDLSFTKPPCTVVDPRQSDYDKYVLDRVEKQRKVWKRAVNEIVKHVDVSFMRIDFTMIDGKMFLREVTLSPNAGKSVYTVKCTNLLLYGTSHPESAKNV